jgi:hypothetical protein
LILKAWLIVNKAVQSMALKKQLRLLRNLRS